MKNLSEKALLANLTISQWTARKYDQKISRQVEQDNNAHNAGRYSKILISDEIMKDIQKISSAARIFLYENTLPWGDDGFRLLPATNYLEFMTDFKKFKSEFEIATNKLITQYPQLKEEAKKRLNGMFQEKDYPEVEKLKEKFSIDISFMPISDITDFRLNLSQGEVDKIKIKMEEEISSRITETTKSIWFRIKEAISHMIERLSEKDAIFRDTLITNIQDLVNILPRLNFTNDPAINAIIENMKVLIINPDTLRKNSTIRNSKAQEAQAILDKVNQFII